MLGDVEEHIFGAVELDFETADALAVLVHVVLAAETLEPLCGLVDILDEDAEMVQAGVVETLAELVGLELEDRQVEGAVAEENAVGEHALWPPDDLEVKRLHVELRHLLRILCGDGDVAQLRHYNLFAGL